MPSPKRSPSAKKPAAKKPAPRQTDDDHDDIDDLLAASERENETLISVLEQAQRSQRSLAAAQKRIKDLESKHEAEHRRKTLSLSGERDEARKVAAEAQAELKHQRGQIDSLTKGARTLALSLAKIDDPLEPLAKGDAVKELQRLREAVKAAGGKDGGDAEELLDRARDLVEVLAGRVAQQGKRVALLRQHVDQLEGDVGKARGEGDALRKTLSVKDKELQALAKEETHGRATIAKLEKDLASTADKLDKHTRSSLDAEAKALREHERITLEQRSTAQRADHLAEELAGLRTRLAQAERLASDLGDLLLDACDEMAKVEGVDAPNPDLARRELADLVASLADAADDDLEAALREDICDDLLPSGRALMQILVKRHKGLGQALAAARKREEANQAKAERLGEQLEGEKAAHKAVKQDLARSEAQFKASAKEIDRLAKELTDRANALGDAKGDIARLQSENEALITQATLARQIKTELDGVRNDLNEAGRAIEAQRNDSEQWSAGLKALARALVELAAATESALSAAGLKPEGFIGRFTRSMRKLESDVHSGDDVAALLKSSLDMSEKAGARIAQLDRELRVRGERLAAAERDRDAFAAEAKRDHADLAKATARLHELEEERETLVPEAKRAGDLDGVLAKRTAALDKLEAEHKDSLQTLKATRAELEELRAREAATQDALGKELDHLRKRLSDEQSARREIEVGQAEARDEAEARAAALAVRVTEVEKALEAREARIVSLDKELAKAGDRATKVTEEKKKAEALKQRLTKAEERIKTLEGDLEEAQALAEAADEVDALRAEREDLNRRLKAAEKRAADAGGAAAKATTTAEGLKRKLEERTSAHRGETEELQERVDALAEENRRLKEQLAGLNARVRTLTEIE